jgi:hypothetical protein
MYLDTARTAIRRRRKNESTSDPFAFHYALLTVLYPCGCPDATARLSSWEIADLYKSTSAAYRIYQFGLLLK